MKNGRKKIICLLLLIFTLSLLPVTVFAANTTSFMVIGNTKTITFSSNPVPNAKWKSSKPAVLKITKQSGKSVTAKGLKAGTSVLTVYNKKKTSQKYSFTIKVMKPNKLVKNDFIVTGNQARNYFGASPYNLFANASTRHWTGTTKAFVACDIRASGLTHSNTGTYLTTYRGVHIFDSYSKVCLMYGNQKLKKTTTGDYFYKYNVNSSKYSAAWIKNFKNYWSGQFKYYVEYKYNAKWKIRMYFNSSKELIGVLYKYNC